ncbi:MAG TPA: hypothetical protein VJB82_01700 [Candidatus Peribacterales bacterium]|nr:hypothetical protein [Candidatus Peribacterales bacterium]
MHSKHRITVWMYRSDSSEVVEVRYEANCGKIFDVEKKIIAITLLILSACSRSNDDDSIKLRAAESGLRLVVERTKQDPEALPSPAAISGLVAGSILGKPILESEYEEGSTLPDGRAAEDTRLIQILVQLLDKDIQNVLNSASKREDGLDAYINAIESTAQKGEIRLRALQDTLERSEDDSSRFERRIREIQNEIEDVIAEGNTTQVNVLTDELIQKQQLLAEADVDVIVNTHLISAYEDVLEPIENRLKAIRANRDALIKGVTITDMPGVEDLKIIEYEDGAIRVRSSGRSFF